VTARYQQNIQSGAIGSRCVGENPHSASTADGRVALGDEQELDRLGLGFARHLEDFPWTHKIEFLDVIEQ
jgi:hypothetical protein